MVGFGEMFASAVVKEIIGRLTQPVIDEIALHWGHKAEVEKMVVKMKDFDAVMQDADDRLRRGESEGAESGRWLMKLKSVAYDIEDVLDDLDAANKQSMFPKVMERICKPHKMEKVRKKIEELNNDRHSLKLMPSQARPGENNNNETIGANNGMVGRVKEMENIINLLFSSEAQEDITIIPIVGLGGIGKTTLAQSVFSDEKVKKFFHFKAWVHVSKEFNLHKIGRTIMESLNRDRLNTDPNIHNCTLDILRSTLEKELHTIRYLIVLDDLWEEDDQMLNTLKAMLKHGSKGSKIIVTTRNLSVAEKLCSGSPAPHPPSHHIILDILSPDECWDLMKIKVLGHLDKQRGLEEIGMQIAHKCVGVPLVVNALAQVMSELKDVKDWKDIRDSKVKLGLRAEHQDKTLECLMLSYYFMKRELKLCFNYLVAFPKGFVLNSDLLIKQWDALGYIPLGYDGKRCINYFIGMSFLQTSGSSLVGSSSVNAKVRQEVILHDLVHELASIITADEFHDLDATKQKKWDISIHCRHVQLTEYKNQFNVFKYLPDKLRSLHFRNSDEMQLSEKAFSRFKYIRILDLSSPLQNRYSLNTLPDNICNLYKLCYLDLSGNRGLKKLPTSLGKLSKLTFLNLSGCSILQKLPKSICQLISLQHLDMSKCCAIQILPDKVGKLENLLFLSFSGCSKLTKLPESFNLESLEHLDLSSCHELENLPQDFGKLQKLVFLSLSDCYKVSVLPESFCELVRLEKLDLSDCHGLRELPKCFGNLSELDNLNLTSCSKLQELPESFSKLCKLRQLNLSHCLRLENFPSSLTGLELQVLDISYSVFRDLPDSLLKMTSLTQLVISSALEGVIEKAHQIKKGLNLPGWITHKIENQGCSSIVDLSKLTCHQLKVSQLQNVRNPQDAERAKLRDKIDLQMLCLSWAFEGYEGKSVLERLIPPRTLEVFFLEGYMSKDFPNWMSDVSSYLPYLTFLSLNNIEKCDNLPPFGRLPNLRSLVLENIPNLTNIGKEFYGDGGGTCTKLRTITLKSMGNLVEWWTTLSGKNNEESLIPNLHYLDLMNCAKLKFVPYPPKSMMWRLRNSNMVLPNEGFGKLSSSILPFEMVIQNCNFSLENWDRLQHLPTLEILHVASCNSLRAFPEAFQCLSSLRKLQLWSLKDLETLPEWLGKLTSLEGISIKDCPMVSSLPASLKNLTALRELWLEQCEGLEVLPEGLGQLISLQELNISLCHNLLSLPESIKNLTVLKKLHIYGCPSLVERCRGEDAHMIGHIPKVELEDYRVSFMMPLVGGLSEPLVTFGDAGAWTFGDDAASTSGDPGARTFGDAGASTSGDAGEWTFGDAEASSSGDAEAWTSGDVGPSTSGDSEAWTFGDPRAPTSGDVRAWTFGNAGASTSGDARAWTFGKAGASTSGYARAWTYGDAGASTSGDAGVSPSEAVGGWASFAASAEPLRMVLLPMELGLTSGDAGTSTSGEDVGGSASSAAAAESLMMVLVPIELCFISGDAGASNSRDPEAASTSLPSGRTQRHMRRFRRHQAGTSRPE